MIADDRIKPLVSNYLDSNTLQSLQEDLHTLGGKPGY